MMGEVTHKFRRRPEIGGKKSEFFLELMYVCTTSNRSLPSLTRRSFNAGPNYPLAAILDIFQHLP